MTHKYMLSLWSRAVRVYRGDVCAACGEPAHQCHHIIKVRYRILSYDVANGIPVCMTCHPQVDRNNDYAMSLIGEDDRMYLRRMAMYTLKDWLVKIGMSKASYLKEEADTLKRIIKGE